MVEKETLNSVSGVRSPLSALIKYNKSIGELDSSTKSASLRGVCTLLLYFSFNNIKNNYNYEH